MSIEPKVFDERGLFYKATISEKLASQPSLSKTIPFQAKRPAISNPQEESVRSQV